MVQPATKTWGVGVELAEDHFGPVRFAATLTQTRPDDRVIGVHVLPDQQTLHPLVSDEEVEAFRKRAIINVSEVLAREGLDGEQVSVELVEDDEIHRGLLTAADRFGLDALILGRRAKRDEDPIVRLGQVTRRALRGLPVPIIVVPPDYGNRHDRGLGEGPVILASDLSQHAASAARFAQELAARLDRELLIAHGTQALHWTVSYIPSATLSKVQQHATNEAEQSLQRWAAAQGLGGARQHVFLGDPAKQLVQLAYTEDAAMLVTGSRVLGPVERILLASVSSEIAAAATCPVAVVPSTSSG